MMIEEDDSNGQIESLWARIKELSPRLRSHVEIHRHFYREELWYVLEDKLTGKYHRFTPDAHRIIGLMDGARNLEKILHEVNSDPAEVTVEEENVCWVLQQLQSSDLLQSGVSVNTKELLDRYNKKKSMIRGAKFKSPLFMKFPLVDPEKLLIRLEKYVSPLFSKLGLCAWLIVVFSGVVLAGIHWDELTGNVIDRALSAQNLLILLTIYPFVKILHEFGHAFAVKRWGGEVHEMGLMLLVFMPVPYVDASAASVFPDKKHRMLVGAAGIFVEVFLAAIAMILWVNLEPGMLRAAAFNAMIIAGVSTLLFNGNPLLRFDGYYIFADFLEMPNLARRSSQFLLYNIRKYILGISGNEVFPESTKERSLLFSYALASFCYRMMILVGIVLLVAGRFFIFGVILAIWAFIGMFGVPLFRFLRYLAISPAISGVRVRASLITGSISIAVVLLLFVMPFPLWSRAEGVVWMPPESIIRTGIGCFVEELVVSSGTEVEAGETLLRCSEPELDAQLLYEHAVVKELEFELDAAFDNPVDLEIIRERLRGAQADLLHTEQLHASLDVKSTSKGMFIMPESEDKINHYYFQGQEIAYVVRGQDLLARVVVPQDDITEVRQGSQSIEVKFVGKLDEVVSARIDREVPEATDELPSAALSSQGGGDIVLDPTAGTEATAFERYFQFDLKFDEPVAYAMVGQRLYARFDHGYLPLGMQWYRGIRRMILRRYDI